MTAADNRAITVVIGGRPHQLVADDPASFSTLSAGDRQQLLSLLQALSKPSVAREAAISSGPVSAPHRNGAALQEPKPERMGAGDVDALMAKLIAEDQRDRATPPGKHRADKVLAVIAIGLFILWLI